MWWKEDDEEEEQDEDVETDRVENLDEAISVAPAGRKDLASSWEHIFPPHDGDAGCEEE